MKSKQVEGDEFQRQKSPSDLARPHLQRGEGFGFLLQQGSPVWAVSESSRSLVKRQMPGSLQEPLYFLLLPKTNTPEPLPFRRVEGNN